jgi:hypothetical protein
MANIWAKRVEGWRKSGLSSIAFAEGKDFTGGGLRHMAYRLRLAAAKHKKRPVIRLARVVRVPGPAPTAVAAASAAVVVVVGTTRVEVQPGATREVLMTVLEVLAERGAR